MKTRQIFGDQNVITIEATEAITAKRFVTPDGKHTAGEPALGVALFDTDSGDQISVACGPCEIVEAGDEITAAGEVEADASGRAITKATGESCGYTPDITAAAGEFIRVYRLFR